MQCLIISDVETDKSAASLDVHVGCSLDEKPFYGTAHFLEHMLFMGSEKYPSENEYSEYIKNNGGYSNAYTSLTNTNYQFEVSNEALEGALDRFAQFFISPLLGEDQTEREMKAVDSEYNMSLQSDAWRMFMLQQTLSHEDSKLHRFNCGNIESLKRDGIRDQLLQFHKKWYSANIMKLVVVGKDSLDQLELWATQMFSSVVNKDVEVPDLGQPAVPFTHGNLSKIQRFKPVLDKDELLIFWVLPYCELEYTSQPLRYFTHLFGHEGENSILSYLTKEGYAMSLSAGEDHEIGVFSDFTVKIGLTKKGLANYEKVIQAVFKYAQRLVEVGPQEFVFKECQTIGEIKFDYADKGSAINYCVTLASTMQRFEDPDRLKHLLRHRYIADHFAKDRVQEIASLLANPQNTLSFLTSKSFDDSTLPNDEYWYKIKFSSEKYSEELLQQLNKPEVVENGKKLDLPPHNTLLPKNFDILGDNVQLSSTVNLISVWDDTEVWYKKDDKFKRPKAIVNLKIYTNDCDFSQTSEGRLFSEVWLECLNEFAREFTYMASCATLNVDTVISPDNINIKWSGFNDSLPIFIEETINLLHKMKDTNIEDIFNDKKEFLLQQYKNFYLNQTFRLAWGSVNYNLQKLDSERRKLKELLEKLTYQDFKQMQEEWLKTGRMIWSFFGNISKESALKTVQTARKEFNLSGTKREELKPYQQIKLPEGQQRVDFPVEDITNDNSALISYFQHSLVEATDLKTCAQLSLTEQFLDEPTFNQLRTIEQLGYVVFTRKNQTRDVNALQFCIQSPKHCCSYIKNSLEKHLSNMLEKVRNMSDEEFATNVKSVLVSVEEKDKNLNEEYSRFQGEISSHRYQFDRQEKDAETLRALKKDEWQLFFEDLFFTKCKRVDFRYNSQAHQKQEEETEFKFENEKRHSSITEFRQSMEAFPDSIKGRYSLREFKC